VKKPILSLTGSTSTSRHFAQQLQEHGGVDSGPRLATMPDGQVRNTQRLAASPAHTKKRGARSGKERAEEEEQVGRAAALLRQVSEELSHGGNGDEPRMSSAGAAARGNKSSRTRRLDGRLESLVSVPSLPVKGDAAVDHDDSGKEERASPWGDGGGGASSKDEREGARLHEEGRGGGGHKRWEGEAKGAGINIMIKNSEIRGGIRVGNLMKAAGKNGYVADEEPRRIPVVSNSLPARAAVGAGGGFGGVEGIHVVMPAADWVRLVRRSENNQTTEGAQEAGENEGAQAVKEGAKAREEGALARKEGALAAHEEALVAQGRRERSQLEADVEKAHRRAASESEKAALEGERAAKMVVKAKARAKREGKAAVGEALSYVVGEGPKGALGYVDRVLKDSEKVAGDLAKAPPPHPAARV
jgi:hypothetical protein